MKVYKKFYALVPSEREKECDHKMCAYTGAVPCTGPYKCLMCGAFIDRATGKPIEEASHGS